MFVNYPSTEPFCRKYNYISGRALLHSVFLTVWGNPKPWQTEKLSWVALGLFYGNNFGMVKLSVKGEFTKKKNDLVQIEDKNIELSSSRGFLKAADECVGELSSTYCPAS